MKARLDKNIEWKQITKLLGRYKYMLIVIAVGAIFLLIPTSKSVKTEKETNLVHEEDFSVDALEEQLEEILSEIENSGQVRVMLTVESGMKRVFAQDAKMDQDGTASTRETETVVISSGTGKQETVLIQQIYPTFQGALIVAEGGGDPSVRLKLTEAVAALTGLGADKISVCKGK